MATLLASILFLIFLFLSGIHVYWAFGGQWASGAVIPTRDDEQQAMMPGILPTLIVAMGLLGFGFTALLQVMIFNSELPGWLMIIRAYGLWIIAGIFIIRAIGDFHYVGFFKKIRHTKFAVNDTKLYTPLCLLVGTLAIILELSK
ncbi:MAG: DUF3995 domain-containing protein [Cytophaga sp.]|uniref:DUF3995 domain-containing protein n=1 Tax=Cytophaga sp. TaxID=29535 RepID=UPI003F7DEF0E